MLDFLRLRLRQPTPTARYPLAGDTLPDRFRGRAVLDRTACTGGCLDRAEMTGPIRTGADGRAVLDYGYAQFTPEEADVCQHGALRFTNDFGLASATRDGLVTSDGSLPDVRALSNRLLRLFGRSLRLRSVAAGSCNGCEAELVALSNVVFDLARFGIQFVASPRHADGLVITGVVNRNMLDALRKTYEATPDPKIVIAVGACAISGGPFQGSDEVVGIPDDIPVDLWVPGCPPHPLTLLDGLHGLLNRAGRLASAGGT